MSQSEETTTENNLPDFGLAGGAYPNEVEAFVKESQKILDSLLTDNANLRKELKAEKELHFQLSRKVVEESATMLEEASRISEGFIAEAKEKAEALTTDADAYAKRVRDEADAYRASIVNEVETERDLIALEVEELNASYVETKARIVSFYRSQLDNLESSDDEQDDESGNESDG